MAKITAFLVSSLGQMGYIGIFSLMFLESSFFPFPSEIVMVPAGYLASQGLMNLYLAIIIGSLGSLTGALFNYWLAVKFGRALVLRFMKSEKLEKLDRFFAHHGHISTFSGRLIPGVRQYISFPAGLARMNLVKFSLYTLLGAGIWVTVLTLLGYFIGENQALIHRYIKEITLVTLVGLTILIGWYVKKQKRH